MLKVEALLELVRSHKSYQYWSPNPSNLIEIVIYYYFFVETFLFNLVNFFLILFFYGVISILYIKSRVLRLNLD
jgi:hypothetical protein